jgi:hypothetical protein
MDIAVTIFRVGVGIGAVLVGLAIVLIAFSLRPLARDARALANDARRLANLAERELSSIIDGARQLTSGTEDEAAELEQRLERLHRQAQELEAGVAQGPAVTVAATVSAPLGDPPSLPARDPAPVGPVQSPDTDEDGRIG